MSGTSLKKLDKVLNKYGIVINKVYNLRNKPVYIEIISADSTIISMIYLPSSDNFINDLSYNIATVDLHKQQLNESNDIITNYIDINASDELIYNNTNSQADLHNGGHTLELGSKNIYESHHTSISSNAYNKSLIRQISRLSNCIKGYKNFGLCIKDDQESIIYMRSQNDEYSCYSFTRVSMSNAKLPKTIHVLIDTRVLFDHIQRINLISTNITDHIFTIITTNLDVHKKMINICESHKHKIHETLNKYHSKHNEYTERIAKLNIEFDKFVKIEAGVINEYDNSIDEIERKYKTNATSKNINLLKNKSHFTKKIDDISMKKNEVYKNLISLNMKKQDISLYIDRVMFDISMMVKFINQNINSIDDDNKF